MFPLNSLEIIEPDNFCDYIAELISTFENDTENIPYFHFQCEVNISTFNKLEKEIADELVELIEDVDDFAWVYVFFIIFIIF